MHVRNFQLPVMKCTPTFSLFNGFQRPFFKKIAPAGAGFMIAWATNSFLKISDPAPI
jgi:hypothetical protein